MGTKIIPTKNMKYPACLKNKKIPKGIPGKLYGYMLLCRKVLKEKPSNEKVETLPFVGKMLEKASFLGIRYACLNFLQY